MKRLLILAALACVAAMPAKATNAVYIAQSSAGANDGSSCGNAKAASYFNTGGNYSGSPTGIQIGPDTTVHLCGTITTALTAQGSGTSGHPIIVVWETGAKVSLPFCASTGCFDLSGESYITLDGGVPCGPTVTNKASCNGIIEANANGTSLANQNNTGTGLRINNVTNIEVKNLVLQNFYVHSSPSDTAPSAPLPACISASGTASQVNIHDNTLHDSLWCINFVGGSVQDHIYLHNNETYHTGHAYALGVTTQTDDSIYIYGNYDHDHVNWDTPGCSYHDDGIHAYQTSGGNITNLFEYNNVFGGDWGSCPTAMIYTEGIAFQLTAFNNLGNALTTSATIPNGCFTLTVGASGTLKAYNNTCMMPSTQGNMDVKYEGAVDVQNNATFGTNQILVILPTDVTVPSGKLIDYNAWGGNPASQLWFRSSGSTYMNFTQWKTYLQATFSGSGGDAHGIATTSPPSLGLDSTGQVLPTSPLKQAGHNLFSICNGQPNPGIGALCYDASGNVRPSSGNWEIGAYNSSSLTLTLTPNPVAFGSQNTGTTSSPSTVTVTNSNPTSVTLGSPTFYSHTGSNPTEFARTGGSCSAGQVLAPAGTCTIAEAFSPGAAGARSARLNMVGGASGSTDMTGTGTSPGGGTNKVNAALELKNQVPVANGGLGLSAVSNHQTPVGTGTNVYTAKTIPDCQDSAGNHLNFTQSTNAYSCGSTASAGTVTTTGSPASGNLTKFSGSTSVTNADLSGDVTTSGTLATTIAANAVTAAKTAVVLTRRTCMIPIGADNAAAVVVDADLGPQGRQCFVPFAATVVEITVSADGGTPNVIPRKNHAGSTSNLVSSALATGSSGAIACSNTGGTTGIDGATTCSATLQNTSLSAGDWIELASGTAGGTAKRMSIAITYTVN